AKKALVTDEDLRQRALSKEMMMRDQISILADNVEAALKRGFQLGAGQGLIEGKLKFCLELYQEGTMDSEAARSKMKRLLGSGFDDLVQEYLDKLP
ncbi:MAG: hypothetical protein H3C47_03670, partial [Candidatus Cloacimonetes bacterium]|nr:hypothetical protein [Candidatus Cloacimonadota bacterium]